ncbi:hypothetical protein [Mesorhizobium shangrilense]|uniref:Uncharacterized protein n=1 Tax=Mesorhizobium shangrilense TaxID=460060 RepID=A0ABV2DRR5_9HYPH
MVSVDGSQKRLRHPGEDAPKDVAKQLDYVKNFIAVGVDALKRAVWVGVMLFAPT